ncbi:MAG TPA: protein kinase [Labilithrix sp.]|nr:protein kinase [Labilithrix sp.]
MGFAGEDPFDLEGDLLDGQFRVDKIVGEGELSVVYRGLHQSMNAPVAIKCLNLPQTLEPQLVEPISESFREGARVHYRLAQGHLHIVQTLALGTTLAPRTGQLIPYVVREWLEGRSLAADFAARARDKTRPRSPTQAVELLESAADAIAHAHAEGVAHHALSPRNLFIAKTRGGEVLKVLDFGMARDPSLQRPDAGLRLLFSSYAAPEQLDRRLGAPCAATDVFAFALVLFEVFAGRPYFSPGTHTSEVLRIAATREPLSRRAPGLLMPRDLDSVLSRALAPTPRERHANLRVFWDDVKRAVQRSSPRSSAAQPPRALPEAVAAPPLPGAVSMPAASVATVAFPPPPGGAPASRGASSLRSPMIADQAPLFGESSCTDEVARPVTTSAVFASVPDATALVEATATAPEDEVAIDRDTMPVPPMFPDEAEASPHGLASPHRDWLSWLNAQRLEARQFIARSPNALLQLGVVPSISITVAVIVLVALTASRAGTSSSAVAAPTGHDSVGGHTVERDRTELLLSDVGLVSPRARAFDGTAMRNAFEETAADLGSCVGKGGPRGPGSIRVLIQPSGKITRLQIGPPYVGTAIGDCICKRFVATPLPTFVGPPRAMNYAFTTIPFD